MIAAGIRFHDAGIDREAFALHQACSHARPDNRLEQLPEDVAIAEPSVAIDGKCRMVWNFVIEVKPAEPAIGKMKLDLFA